MLVIEVPVSDTVDSRGRPASFAIQRLQRALEAVRPGAVVALWTTDPVARMEIADWTATSGHRLVGIETRDGYDEIMVARATDEGAYS